MLPAFQAEPFADSTQTNEYRVYGLEQLHKYSQEWVVSDEVLQKATEDYVSYGTSLIYLDICEEDTCVPQVSTEIMYGWIQSMTFDNGAKTHPTSDWVSDHLLSTKAVRSRLLIHYSIPPLLASNLTPACFISLYFSGGQN